MQYSTTAASSDTRLVAMTLGPVLDTPFFTGWPSHPIFNTSVCLWQWSKDKNTCLISPLSNSYYINRSIIINEIMLLKMLCMSLTKQTKKQKSIFKRIVPLALYSAVSLTPIPSAERKWLTMKTFKKLETAQQAGDWLWHSILWNTISFL